MYSKRTFSLVGFVRSLAMNAIYMPRFLIALIKPSTSAALREQVMLGCTSVNDCRYCTWLHTNLALKNAVDVDELNEFMRETALHSKMKKQIDFSISPESVSSDFVGSRAACVFDAKATIVNGNQAVLYLWYDNEFGYSCQVYRVLERMAGIRYQTYPANNPYPL